MSSLREGFELNTLEQGGDETDLPAVKVHQRQNEPCNCPILCPLLCVPGVLILNECNCFKTDLLKVGPVSLRLHCLD